MGVIRGVHRVERLHCLGTLRNLLFVLNRNRSGQWLCICFRRLSTTQVFPPVVQLFLVTCRREGETSAEVFRSRAPTSW